MKQKIIFVIIGVILLAIAAVSLSESQLPTYKGMTPIPTQQPSPTVPQTSSPEQPRTIDVEIINFAFSPATITIKVGDSVRWTNRDSVRHNVAADDNGFDTGLLGNGQSGTITFDRAGTYDYHCTPHPWMKAKIIVE